MSVEPATREVAFASGNQQLTGYLAIPRGDRPAPGVIVIHEAFGLNDDMRSIAHRFAVAGYAALAVDLFSGRSRSVCMIRLFTGMSLNSRQHGGIRDLRSALTFFADQQGVDRDRLGAIGFCLGGGLAIGWACSDHRLKAIAPYYAINPRPLRAVARACPIVGSYPGFDFTTSQGRKLDGFLETQHLPHDIVVYPRTMHSFFNKGMPTYNASASDDSWQRVLEFFGRYVARGTMPGE